MNIVLPIASALAVSLIAVIAAIPLYYKKKVSDKTLLLLLSASVGVLLATVFMDFLPEAISHGYTLGLAIYLLLGFLVMFIIEKFIHTHHHSKRHSHKKVGHAHEYHLAPIVLIGEAVHNFIDGLVIAGSYAVSTTLGITATISIIFHEVPQEIADFGVLLYSGLSRKRALAFNFLTAITAIAGTILGLFLSTTMTGFKEFIIPFACGNFIYIAATNLVPQLHRQCKTKESIMHLLAILTGIIIITLITLYGPAHGH